MSPSQARSSPILLALLSPFFKPSVVYANDLREDSSSSKDVAAETEVLKDNYGLGFGGIVGANGAVGLNLQGDFNFHPTGFGFSQLHLMGAWSNRIDGDFWSSNINGTTISMNADRLAITYRWVFTSGFYLGAGYGKTTGNITYKARDFFAGPTNDTRQTFTFASTFVPFDIGWQGSDGYYFSIGAQPSKTLTGRNSYREGSLPKDSSKLAKFKKIRDAADDSTAYYFDFGWYIR